MKLKREHAIWIGLGTLLTNGLWVFLAGVGAYNYFSDFSSHWSPRALDMLLTFGLMPLMNLVAFMLTFRAVRKMSETLLYSVAWGGLSTVLLLLPMAAYRILAGPFDLFGDNPIYPAIIPVLLAILFAPRMVLYIRNRFQEERPIQHRVSRSAVVLLLFAVSSSVLLIPAMQVSSPLLIQDYLPFFLIPPAAALIMGLVIFARVRTEPASRSSASLGISLAILGTIIAAGNASIYYSPKTMRVISIPDGRELYKLRRGSSVLSFSADSKTLVGFELIQPIGRNIVRFWRAADGTPIHGWGLPSHWRDAYIAAFSQDGSLAAVVDDAVYICDANGRIIKTIGEHGPDSRHAALGVVGFTPNGNLVTYKESDKLVYRDKSDIVILDARNGWAQRRLRLAWDEPLTGKRIGDGGFHLSQDGRLLAGIRSISDDYPLCMKADRHVAIWRMADGKLLHKIAYIQDDGPPSPHWFSADLGMVASTDRLPAGKLGWGNLVIRGTSDGRLISQINLDSILGTPQSRGISFSVDLKRVLIIERFKVRILSLPEWKPIYTYEWKPESRDRTHILSAVLSPDNRMLAVVVGKQKKTGDWFAWR